MVNQRAKKAVRKNIDNDKEMREARSRMKYRRTYVSKKNNPVLNMTFIQPHDWIPILKVHHFAGKRALKMPVICPKMYGHKDCEICEMESNLGGQCWPDTVMPVISYIHDYEGKVFRADNGKKYPFKPTRIIEIPRAGDDEPHWELMREMNEAGRFNKCVFQLKKLKRGMRLSVLSKTARAALHNKGVVPKEVLEEFAEFTEDEYWGHIANCYKGFDYDFFGVEELVVKDEDDDKEDEAAEDDDDEDEDSDTKTVRKASTKKSVKRRQESEDEEDDEESEEETEEEEAEEKPARKKSKKRPEPEPEEDEEDDEEDSDEDSEDDSYDLDEEEDEEEEEPEPEEKPRKKPRPSAKVGKRLKG